VPEITRIGSVWATSLNSCVEFESAAILGAQSLEVQMVDREPALDPSPNDAHRSD